MLWYAIWLCFVALLVSAWIEIAEIDGKDDVYVSRTPCECVD